MARFQGLEIPFQSEEQTGEELLAALLEKPSNRRINAHEKAQPRRRRFILCGCMSVSCPASYWDDESPGDPDRDAPRSGRPSPNSLRDEYGPFVRP